MRWRKSSDAIEPTELIPLEHVKKKNMNIELSNDEDDSCDEDPKPTYKPSKFENFINRILCRGDLATQQLSAKPVSIIGLFRYAEQKEHVLLLLGVLLSCISGASSAALGIIAGGIYNSLLTYNVTSDKFYEGAMSNVKLFGGVGIGLLGVNWAQYMCFQYCCIRLVSKLKQHYIKSILHQNASWFDKNHSGTLTMKLHDNMERIHEGIGDKLGLLIRGVVMFMACIVISFHYKWKLALMMTITAPLFSICASLTARISTSFTEKEAAGTEKASSIAEESLMGVRTVQAFNGQEEMVEKYSAELGKGKTFAIKKGFWSGFINGIVTIILNGFFGGGLFYGGYLLRWGTIQNPGDVITVVFTMLVGASFLSSASPHLEALLTARVAAATIYEIIDRTPEIDAYSTKGRHIPNIIGKVVFDDVHFRYPTRKKVKVLNGLNLIIEPGTCVALVGHSGCGKSTSAGLLTRLYEQEEGKVLIDGEDIRDLNIDWLRKVVGVVQQEPVLFNDTIRNNILIGNPESSEDDMIRVAQMANAHDFILKMSNGYNTLIGDGGVQLSGGQKQRIAIARTLIRNPKILILDEATSALDAHSESVIKLNNTGRTTIIIAHRLSTIREADQIVFFENGVIVESGNHEELVALGGRYAILVRAQQFKEVDQVQNEEEYIDIVEHPVPSRPISYHRSSESLISASVFPGGIFHSNAFKTGEVESQDSTTEQVQMDKKSYGYLDILKNAQGNYWKLLIGTVFAILKGSELAISAIMFSRAFEAFEKPDDEMESALETLFVLYGCIGVYIFVTHVISSTLFTIIAENLGLKFRVESFRSLLHQDAVFYDSPAHSPGKLITILAKCAPNIKAILDIRMLQVINSITAITINLVVGYVNCWQIAIIGSIMLALFAVLMISLAYKIAKENRKQMKRDEAGKIAIEIIENVKTIQLLTSTQKFLDNYKKSQMIQQKSDIKKCYIQSINNAISQTFMYFVMALCYGIGTPLMYYGYIEPNGAFRAINAMITSAIAINQFSPNFPEFVKAKTAASQLFKLIYRKPQTGDIMKGDWTTIQGDIQFENVNFSYPRRPMHPVMKGLQFSVRKGQTIALVGPSGTGKSTCISMLERFYDVCGGSVLIDGRDIREFSLYHLRSQMALVGQEPRLFAGTIKENVCFGLKNVSLLKLWRTMAEANVSDFLNDLPASIETEVGEKGSQLSGGQKQRIAIARALIRDPKILLLDEATSALDSEAERAVQEALDRARKGRTCITIAHRLSSIQNADLIVYIDEGKVQEAGNHVDLMALRGKYFELVENQKMTL